MVQSPYPTLSCSLLIRPSPLFILFPGICNFMNFRTTKKSRSQTFVFNETDIFEFNNRKHLLVLSLYTNQNAYFGLHESFVCLWGLSRYENCFFTDVKKLGHPGPCTSIQIPERGRRVGPTL